jgi:hypothetical protein
MSDHEAVKNAVVTNNIGGGYLEIQEQNLAHYTKFVPALLAAAGTTFVQLSGHGNTLFLVLSIAIAVLAAYGTYQFSAGDKVLNSAKFWTNVVAVVLQGVLAIVGSGGNLSDITHVQWVTIGLSVLSALGVSILPNAAQYSMKVVQTGAPDPVTGMKIVTPLASPTSSDPTTQPQSPPYSDGHGVM